MSYYLKKNEVFHVLIFVEIMIVYHENDVVYIYDLVDYVGDVIDARAIVYVLCIFLFH